MSTNDLNSLEERIVKMINSLEERVAENINSLEKGVKKFEKLKNRIYILISVLLALGLSGGWALKIMYDNVKTTERLKDETVAASNEAKSILKKMKAINIDSLYQELTEIERRYSAISENLKKAENYYSQVSGDLESAKSQYHVKYNEYNNLIQQLRRGVTLQIPNSRDHERYFTGDIFLRNLSESCLVDGKPGSKQRFRISFDENTRSLRPILSDSEIVKFNFR
jgi:flagellar biosynthesis chaperone FliJ